MSNIINIDTLIGGDFNEKLQQYREALIKARKTAVKIAARQLYKKTQSLMQSEMPQLFNETSVISKGSVYTGKISDGLQISKYKDENQFGESVSGVHVLGKKKFPTSFILKFFEGGTASRRIKKYKGKAVTNGNRGRIIGKNFLSRSADGNIINQTIQDEINKVLSKIGND